MLASSFYPGFGCGSYNGVDFDGAAKPDEPNIDMPSFLKAVDEKRVVEVRLHCACFVTNLVGSMSDETEATHTHAYT